MLFKIILTEQYDVFDKNRGILSHIFIQYCDIPVPLYRPVLIIMTKQQELHKYFT